MYKDPIDVEKRKPARLRGTPANRFSFALAVGFVSAFSAFAYWYYSSEAEWIQRRKRHHLELLKPQEKEMVRRESFKDPLFGAALVVLNERAAAKEAGEDAWSPIKEDSY